MLNENILSEELLFKYSSQEEAALLNDRFSHHVVIVSTSSTNIFFFKLSPISPSLILVQVAAEPANVLVTVGVPEAQLFVYLTRSDPAFAKVCVAKTDVDVRILVDSGLDVG